MATDHRKVATDRCKVATDHRKVATDHRKVVTDHCKVATDHRKVATDHRKVAIDHRKVATDRCKVATDKRQFPIRMLPKRSTTAQSPTYPVILHDVVSNLAATVVIRLGPTERHRATGSRRHFWSSGWHRTVW